VPSTTTNYARQVVMTNQAIDSLPQPLPAGCQSVELEVLMEPADLASGLTVALSKQDSAGTWRQVITFICNGIASHSRMQTACVGYTDYRVQGQVTGTVTVTLDATITTGP
jgi:hypothetical protein